MICGHISSLQFEVFAKKCDTIFHGHKSKKFCEPFMRANITSSIRTPEHIGKTAIANGANGVGGYVAKMILASKCWTHKD